MSTACILVDIQGDFLPGGALGVPDGHQIIRPAIEFAKQCDVVALTGDYHPPHHISFSDDPQFVDKSWPPHCVQGTPGALIDPEVLEAFPGVTPFLKGTVSDKEAYSGFEGYALGERLVDFLDDHDVGRVYVAGLALDYCVHATARDAVREGFETIVLLDATRPVSYVTGAKAIADLADEGVAFSTTEDILRRGGKP